VKKTGMGILYLCSRPAFFIGWIIDLFTLGRQADQYNANPPEPHRPAAMEAFNGIETPDMEITTDEKFATAGGLARLRRICR
jgi:hypothetical protein